MNVLYMQRVPIFSTEYKYSVPFALVDVLVLNQSRSLVLLSPSHIIYLNQAKINACCDLCIPPRVVLYRMFPCNER